MIDLKNYDPVLIANEKPLEMPLYGPDNSPIEDDNGVHITLKFYNRSSTAMQNFLNEVNRKHSGSGEDGEARYLYADMVLALFAGWEGDIVVGGKKLKPNATGAKTLFAECPGFFDEAVQFIMEHKPERPKPRSHLTTTQDTEAG